MGVFFLASGFPIDHVGGVSMIRTAVAVVGIAAAVLLAASFTKDVSAETAAKPPACKTLKDADACRARTDCSWVKASIDSKTGKEKRKAYCRSKPAKKKK
jgi:hypothetical protein